MSDDSDAHLEVDKEVRHARCDALKVAIAQPCSIWVDLLRYPLVYLQDSRRISAGHPGVTL